MPSNEHSIAVNHLISSCEDVMATWDQMCEHQQNTHFTCEGCPLFSICSDLISVRKSLMEFYQKADLEELMEEQQERNEESQRHK